MDERDAAQRTEETFDPAATMLLMVREAGALGALAAVGLYLKQWGTLIGCPVADRILPLVRANYPEAWKQILDSIPHEHHRQEMIRLAGGKVLTAEEIARSATQDDDDKPNGRARHDLSGSELGPAAPEAATADA